MLFWLHCNYGDEEGDEAIIEVMKDISCEPARTE